jgi:hypothetical protein
MCGAVFRLTVVTQELARDASRESAKVSMESSQDQPVAAGETKLGLPFLRSAAPPPGLTLSLTVARGLRDGLFSWRKQNVEEREID